MKTTATIICAAALLLLAGCESKPTPPPVRPGSQVAVRVYVVRDVRDPGTPSQAIGYAWTDGNITTLVNQAMASALMSGAPNCFTWDGIVRTKYFTFEAESHIWDSYINWVDFISNQSENISDYQNGRLSLWFIPGIIDASNPSRFMDSYVVDPARNNDPFWLNHNPVPYPVVLISDCWVWPGINPSTINGANGQGMIQPNYQAQKVVVERALARYGLRFDDINGTNPNWDNQEYWTGSSPAASYMSWWNQRNTAPVAQNNMAEKLSGNFFAP